MIDTHTHLDTRGLEDLELMALTLEKVVTLAHDPFEMKTLDVWEVHLNKVLSEIKRGGKVGLDVYVCLGIHPRAIPPSVDEAIKLLEKYIKLDKVVAIGEIGLEKGDKKEEEAFIKQVEFANKVGYPIVVHTPRRNKEEITKKILELLQTFNLKVDVVIDHCNKEIINSVLDQGYYAGLTVQPGKLTADEALNLIKDNLDFSDKIMLNSDTSSNYSDVLAVPKTVLKMKLEGIDKEVIEKIAKKNAESFFKF
ncbi:TatD-related deoxyribonuclease [Methanocaldococcus infernus ME]|uniref:TatD-related deoxyribonuclease n=1 Tax=Methanocaldococcus infernus (strain DSM 11812 / JCM 15783 / ME) TaxID=573063 RepID=D5VS36_METIM|nr:TatD family hydrolase [Methanocaldococcus infernus]ADG13389.1 TatD-related deoxyribonuclease [Methanocaldococcus infernus ME]